MVTKGLDPFHAHPHTHTHTCAETQIVVGIFLGQVFCVNIGREGINILLYHVPLIKLQRHLAGSSEGKFVHSLCAGQLKRAFQTQLVVVGQPSGSNCTTN